VTLDFIAVSRSRRSVLMIKKIAGTASVSGKKNVLMPADTAAPEACLRDFARKKNRHLSSRAEKESVFTFYGKRAGSSRGKRHVLSMEKSAGFRKPETPRAEKKAPPGEEEPKYVTS